MKKDNKTSAGLTEDTEKKFNIAFWCFSAFPFVLITVLLLFQSEDEMPSVAMLDNPPELLASVVLASDGETELGRYWRVNRTSAEYKEISPYVTDALISTEDERFMNHSGVDFKALARAVFKLGSAGGASTISQQLAKLLFTLQQREKEELARASGETVDRGSYGKLGRMMRRVNEKAKENIIATRLERRFTKEEIITMYLNQFDFLYNAVGIENAAKVYFDKLPKDLSMEESAMLVGMCKNPSLYNPYTFKIKNYRQSIAIQKGISANAVSREEILLARANDSMRAVNRRNQVLMQWLKNSEEGNEALRKKISKADYDRLKMKPLVVKFRKVDHKQGMAPYFRESLRKELSELFSQKNEDGSWKYKHADGKPYDIYSDGLKIYTTIDVSMQKYAEEALVRHLKESLQPAFDKQNKGLNNWPFSNRVSEEQIENIMRAARRASARFTSLQSLGYSDDEIRKNFRTPAQMTVFSWNGDIDTVMTPDDSIRYYKSYLHAGLISIEPQTGFVKAWVGGANFNHFAYDHVRLGKRQVGSTIKPFVYSTAMQMKAVKPCSRLEPGSTCVDIVDINGNKSGRWCPGGSATGTVEQGLASSSNPTTAAVMGKMGGYAGPKNISKLLRDCDIYLRPQDEVPSMCLGSMDMSLYQMVAAQCIFVNNGIFNRPTTILRIEDRTGNIIYSADGYMKEVLNEGVAYETLLMMKKVITQGTATYLRSGKFGDIPPTAGKTGTTQNNSDGWFMGLTPELVTGVWVGAEDRSIRFKSTAIGQGARVALPIYGYFMQKVYNDPLIKLSKGEFEPPQNYDPEAFKCDGADGLVVETDTLDLGI